MYCLKAYYLLKKTSFKSQWKIKFAFSKNILELKINTVTNFHIMPLWILELILNFKAASIKEFQCYWFDALFFRTLEQHHRPLSSTLSPPVLCNLSNYGKSILRIVTQKLRQNRLNVGVSTFGTHFCTTIKDGANF